MATAAAPMPTVRPRAATGARAVLVRVHRTLGLFIAAFLILAGVTGSALVFQEELDGWLNPDLWAIERPGPSLSPQSIADRVAAADGRVTARWIPLSERPAQAADVWVDWRARADGTPIARAYDQMFVDPVGGRVQGTRAFGTGAPGRHTLMPFIHRLHSALLLPGRWGAILLGVVGLAWLVDSLTGFALTLPRGAFSLRAWAMSWRVKRRTSPFHRVFDLHRANGLWLWGLLILMATSSVALTLPHEVVEPLVDRVSPLTPEVWEGRPAQLGPPAIDFDEALARGTRAARGAGMSAASSGLYYGPEASLYGVRFGREEQAGVGQGWVYLDSATGAVLRVEPPTGGTTGDVAMRAQLAIHAGRIGGMATRVLAALLGLAIAGLSGTGVLIWWRKRRVRRR